MTLTAHAPPALACPRCAGPMYRAASDALDYVCLFCGEYRFLVPRSTGISPALAADLAAPPRGRPRARPL
jgi:hypothetical protein